MMPRQQTEPIRPTAASPRNPPSGAFYWFHYSIWSAHPVLAVKSRICEQNNGKL